jgi:hypothetical protein
MVCCKIHAVCAHRGAKQQVCKCLLWFAGIAQKWPPATHNSCKMMRVRVTAMTLSQSSSQESGSHQIRLDNNHPPPPPKRGGGQVPSSVMTMFVCFLMLMDSAEGVWSSMTNSKSAVLLEWVESIVWQPAMKTSREVKEWGLVLAPWQWSPHT